MLEKLRLFLTLETPAMHAVDIIRRKRDGGVLSAPEIDAFVRAATHGDWPDYQLAALLMAIWLRGMTPEEIAQLTRAMTDSGSCFNWSDLPGPKVDKHSTGGVGDKTSLIVAPLAAACGVIVPMMSGRGLGHSGGTLDKLEAIPGFRVSLNEVELRTALLKVGVGMIGQTREVAPADKRLYALRDVTATVESIPLITASILSKKLAEGIDGLVLDVKGGVGAFMKRRPDAFALAESLVRVGRANGLRTEALLTAMDAPLGRAVGNALEVIEAVETLKGQGPKELTELSFRLTARMVRLGGLAADNAEAEQKVRSVLASGAGLEKFRQIIVQQGGDPKVIDDYGRLPAAPSRILLRTESSGYVTGLHAEKIGIAAMRLGAGRNRADDVIDPAVGVMLQAEVGQAVKAGDPVFEVHYRDANRLSDALPLLREAIEIGSDPPTATLIVWGEVTE
jgi:pyrimidine-nucleoside phosphorylase